ncbi:MAG TPA: universal stress protein [Desulfobacteraceae bacterium]|nr:universal stress protein [Deltaproteobacteria bacterium]MBW2356824.1 universal stress protein [Deltaproteobacteria bacterium]HDI60366.1 universal stress protein [Desulfobacteraceae bacterium]
MRILVGYNGSVESKAAVRLAGELAGPLGARVEVMTSMEGGPRERPEDIAAAEAHLKEASEIMAGRGVTCEVFQSVRGLSPGEDLVDYAKEKAVDLIVVGVEKRSKTQKILLGSTAQYIILKAPCPVLTVK